MAKKVKTLKPLSARDITIFKIANRAGYAAIARNCLTEGRSIPMAYGRLIKACRRKGLQAPEKIPGLTKSV